MQSAVCFYFARYVPISQSMPLCEKAQKSLQFRARSSCILPGRHHFLTALQKPTAESFCILLRFSSMDACT